MLKTFYHGTVTAFLPEIEKGGLRITAKHAWKIHFEHFGELVAPNDGEPDIPGVYVTKDKHHAIAYAQTRADYFQRDPGKCFAFFEFPANRENGDYLFLSKDADAPVKHTHPVLLTLSIDTTAVKLEKDPNDTDYGLVCRHTIPASAISKVEILSDDYDKRAMTKGVREKISVEAYKTVFGNNSALAKTWMEIVK